MSITYTDQLGDVTGETLKRFYAHADFDNGRTAAQHQTAFRNSIVRLAFDGDRLIGAARAITDGVKCAAVFDVCVLPAYRRQGIATRLMRSLVDGLPGQFIVLVCDASLRNFYADGGFAPLHEADVALARPDDLS